MHNIGLAWRANASKAQGLVRLKKLQSCVDFRTKRSWSFDAFLASYFAGHVIDFRKSVHPPSKSFEWHSLGENNTLAVDGRLRYPGLGAVYFWQTFTILQQSANTMTSRLASVSLLYNGKPRSRELFFAVET